jgi:hypothetical protein
MDPVLVVWNDVVSTRVLSNPVHVQYSYVQVPYLLGVNYVYGILVLGVATVNLYK